MSSERATPSIAAADSDRKVAVLESAMATFGRFGYRKTSMDDVAQAAHISRPGLYFLFSSKQSLFRAAVSHALERDLGIIATELADPSRPLAERLIAAFDRWGGPYVGPLTGEGIADGDPSLLGEIRDAAPRRFEELVTTAIADTADPHAVSRAQTIISASIGIKHQVTTRQDYLARLAIATEVILR
jgi:AcrR family transcriptional regulator